MNSTPTPSSSPPARLTDLSWMCGAWTGELGPQTVEEAWSQASGGTMSTMVRLMTATETLMIELIVIREDAQSLVLHLRQFSPALEPRLAQDMPLSAIGDGQVSFLGPQDSNITNLAYRSIDKQTMEIDVTTGAGDVLTASLQRR